MKLMHDISPARRPTLGAHRIVGRSGSANYTLFRSIRNVFGKNGKCNQRFGDQSLKEDFKIMKEAARDAQNRATRTHRRRRLHINEL